MNKEEILEYYSENEMYHLKRLCDSLTKTCGWVNGKTKIDGITTNTVRIENTDMYSIANMVLWKSIDSYDESSGISFENYLKSNLVKKKNSFIRDLNRDKRVLSLKAVSFDADTDEKHPLTETVPEKDTVESIVFANESEKIDAYKSKLSTKQKQIVELLCDGYKKADIIRMLSMNNSEYETHMKKIQRMDIVRLLY